MFNPFRIYLEWALFGVLVAAILSYSNPPLTDETQRIRAYTRSIEFDYLSWMLNATLIKAQQGAVNVPFNLDRASRKEVVTEYFAVTQRVLEYQAALEQIYANPAIKNKEQASSDLSINLNRTQKRLDEVTPLAEAILQEQITQALTDLNLTSVGQPMPSVLYHSSPVPNALIVSPRDHIEQTANISIQPDLTVDQQNALEEGVDKALDVSSLVVPVGGIGVYPTMVMRTENMPWVLTTISHEWTHNFLSLRPLGMLYGNSPELRTMNETTASIVGSEVGQLVLKEYYPELTTGSYRDPNLVAFYRPVSRLGFVPQSDFDFRVEMHTTRVHTDALLAAGKIEAAESYMEARRKVFWDHGYLIRKLNQAYFAFYGAYADVPGGAAGEDPVGPAVRALRAESSSLADFLNRISWMTSFDELKSAVHE